GTAAPDRHHTSRRTEDLDPDLLPVRAGRSAHTGDSETVSETQQPETMRDEDEVSLLDLLIVLAKHKTLVLGLPAAAALISAVVSLLLPNYYTGITKILPPQQTQSTSAVLAQLGNLAGLTGRPAAAGLKNPNDLYVGMLKSLSVA